MSSALTTPSGDVLANLASMLPSLAPSEQRVGKVILSDPARAAQLTITDLAGSADTSETTVIRLCRSVGVGSYPNLRIALATAVGRSGVDRRTPTSPDISPEDDLAEVVAKVSATDARAITDTAANLDIGQLGAVVDAMVAADRVDVYGVAASGFVAQDLQQKLHRIGIIAHAWSDPHMAIPSAANLSAGDVAIGISYSGTTIDTIDALSEASRAGARTVAVTNFSRSPIVKVADHVLRTSAPETSLRSGAMGSRIAALTIVDCMFLGVAQRRYDATVEALDRTRVSVRSRHRSRR